MKLAKALKVKNRLAGEIANAQRLIVESNVVEGANQPAHDVEELHMTLIAKQGQLAELKAKINRANGPIWESIVTLAELKGRAAWYRSIPTKSGTFVEGASRFSGPGITVNYRAQMSASDVEDNIAYLNEKIEKLQDEIDTFNATTEIE